MPERCEVCDWPFRSDGTGCRPGDCSYRPDTHSPEWYRIKKRREFLESKARGEPCLHPEFSTAANINRLENGAGVVDRYQADIRIWCERCGVPFRFIGLPAGVDLNGAAVSVDGTEGRFCIAPKGEVLSELEGTPIGFTVRKERPCPSE